MVYKKVQLLANDNYLRMKKQPLQKNSTCSQHQEQSFWLAFKRFLCPCLVPPQKGSPLRLNHTNFQPIEPIDLRASDSSSSAAKKLSSSNNVTKFSNKDKKMKKLSKQPVQFQNKRTSLLDERSENKELSQIREHELVAYRRSAGNIKRDFPVCSLSEKELISVGINDRHILIKVASIHLSPNPLALKKQLSQTKSQRRQEAGGNANIDKYWVQRYALFERFDEGIKLDDESWVRTPPAPVCEWAAAKCGGSRVVLDAFARVGGSTVKLAACSKVVIANDWNPRRLECISNNAKVYEVDKCVQLSENDFLKIQRKGIEVVFIQPPIGEADNQKSTSLSIVDFQPTLDKIICKALSLANNFILLLPAAICIDVLCSCINKCATELNKMKDSCSAKLEKIYWQGELKYVMLSVGRLVQEQIKLSHELNFIYERLQEPEKGPFRQKKIVKILREQYGMIFLLNLVKESQKKLRQKKKKGEQPALEEFIQLIKERSLIPKQKLEKLLSQLESPNQKKRQSQLTGMKDKNQEIPMESVMEEEKMNQDLPYFRQSEMTQSEQSHYSYLSSLEKPLMGGREPRIFADSFGSIIIKRTINGSRQKRSISPKSPQSPLTPSRKLKNRGSPLNRASQVLPRKKKMQNQTKDY